MIKEYIYFSIGFERVDWGNEEDITRRNDFVKNFTAPFNIQCGFAGNGRIGFDNPKIDKFLSAIEQYSRENKLIFEKNCAYVQEFGGKAEWYKYTPSKSIESIDYEGNLVSCKAANIPPSIHISCGDLTPFVSEKFKKVVLDNNLTGLDFLWCKDVGRFAPPQQWYKAIATNFMGRGLDAPWVNAESPNLLNSIKYSIKLGRMAIAKFPVNCLKQDSILPSRLVRYLSLCDAKVFEITFYERFLRGYLPNADFAFGNFPGWEGFYLSNRAKEILVNSHLFNKYDRLDPVLVLDELPKGEIELDNKDSIPSFFFGYKQNIGDITYSDLKMLHQQEKDKYDKLSKPPKKIKIKKALSLVNGEKRSRPQDFNKRLSDKELNNCNIQLPSNWIELLKKTNGGYLSLECELVPLKDIEKFTADKLKEGKGFYEDYPANRISVAKKGDGDWYDLVPINDFSSDCSIVHVTHEGGEIQREWENIATFIYDMILENEE